MVAGRKLCGVMLFLLPWKLCCVINRNYLIVIITANRQASGKNNGSARAQCVNLDFEERAREKQVLWNDPLFARALGAALADAGFLSLLLARYRLQWGVEGCITGRTDATLNARQPDMFTFILFSLFCLPTDFFFLQLFSSYPQEKPTTRLYINKTWAYSLLTHQNKKISFHRI